MLVGISSQIPYAEFLLRPLPVSLLSMLLIEGTMRLFYRKEFADKAKLPAENETDAAEILLEIRCDFSAGDGGLFGGHYLNLSIPIDRSDRRCAHIIGR